MNGETIINKEFSIQSLINKAVQSEQRDKKEKTSWWPTDLGQCLSGAYYRRLGAKPDHEFDDRSLRLFKVGKLFEGFVVEQIVKSGVPFETQVKVKIPELDLSGYADLVINDLVYELKTVHSDKFHWMSKQGPDEHYQMQLYCYLLGLNKAEGRLLYVSKDDLCISEYVVKLDNDKLRDRVLDDLEALNKAWRDKVPPKPAEGWKANWCHYHSHCTGDKDWKSKLSKVVKKKKSR